VQQILEFLDLIGIATRATTITGETFVPGIRMERGSILYDPSRMTYPGDLLHEAAHIAFATPSQRPSMSDSAGTDAGEEMAAIAWSYAAAIHLNIDPAIVFHNGGYKGSSRALIENFGQRRYIGVPLLQWAEMTTYETFPAMTKWLRD
jgi:hypothetical protein